MFKQGITQISSKTPRLVGLLEMVTRFNDSVITEFTDFPTFAWPTIPRRFIRKELETDKRLLNRL